MMIICGIDEVGRGPLAGPVVAAAVSFDETYSNPEIKDSKKLSAKKRDYLYDLIMQEARDWAIAVLGPQQIDIVNIREAAKAAMSAAAGAVRADRYLVDGNMTIDINGDQETVIGGDRKHVQISAASILAKVWRDREMQRLDQLFKGYDLGKHAGYPTKAHKAAIAALGPSPIHRFSFNGVKNVGDANDCKWPTDVARPEYMIHEASLIYSNTTGDTQSTTARAATDRDTRRTGEHSTPEGRRA